MLLWKKILILASLLAVLHPAPAAAARLPPRAYIDGVRGHAQSYSLSCESRSAADWAAFWGVRIRERAFLNRLPRSDNPDSGFVGDPTDPWGQIPPSSYGVHAGPVAALLKEYGLSAEARRGLTWDELRAEIAAGRPVIVWVIGQMWSGRPATYTAADGQATTVASFEHTMIVVGYAPAAVTVVDAYTGRTQVYPRRVFLDSWATLGNMAVIGGLRQPAVGTGPAPRWRAFLPQLSSAGPARAVGMPAAGRKKKKAAAGELQATYTVRAGDTLGGVAGRFGLTWPELARINTIAYPYQIYTGQVLRLK